MWAEISRSFMLIPRQLKTSCNDFWLVNCCKSMRLVCDVETVPSSRCISVPVSTVKRESLFIRDALPSTLPTADAPNKDSRCNMPSPESFPSRLISLTARMTFWRRFVKASGGRWECFGLSTTRLKFCAASIFGRHRRWKQKALKKSVATGLLNEESAYLVEFGRVE